MRPRGRGCGGGNGEGLFDAPKEGPLRGPPRPPGGLQLSTSAGTGNRTGQTVDCSLCACLCVSWSVKVCRGTSSGLTHTAGVDTAYHEYLCSFYTNCTHIDGNLEIVYLDNHTNYDLSFLKVRLTELYHYLV